MTGGLTILNGGSLKKLKVQNVHYYYDNMDAVISKLKNPIEKYTSLQNSVAKIIRKIGGRGRIHGCIVDIDFCNHIYVNPFDQTVTGYRASNIFDKLVYPSVPSLLKENCPEFYDKYIGLLDQKEKDLLMVSHQTDVALLPQPYLNTDIYSASREIAKLQKLNSNILTSWYDGENAYANLMLTDNTKK